MTHLSHSSALALKTEAIALAKCDEQAGEMQIYRFLTGDGLDELLHCCDRRGSNTVIVGIHLLTTSSVSGSNRRISMPVTEVLRGEVSMTDSSSEDRFIYRLATGEVFTDHAKLNHEQILSAKVVYKAPQGPCCFDNHGHRYELHRWMAAWVVEMGE